MKTTRTRKALALLLTVTMVLSMVMPTTFANLTGNSAVDGRVTWRVAGFTSDMDNNVERIHVPPVTANGRYSILRLSDLDLTTEDLATLRQLGDIGILTINAHNPAVGVATSGRRFHAWTDLSMIVDDGSNGTNGSNGSNGDADDGLLWGNHANVTINNVPRDAIEIDIRANVEPPATTDDGTNGNGTDGTDVTDNGNGTDVTDNGNGTDVTDNGNGTTAPPRPIEDFAFVTQENISAGLVVLNSGSAIQNGDGSARIELPIELLWNEATETFATEIFLSSTTNNAATSTRGNQRGDDFSFWGDITLQVAPCECGENTCISCATHVFPFPLDVTPGMIWEGGYMQGWQAEGGSASNQFTNPIFPPTGARITRGDGNARFMTWEFTEDPGPWGVRFQDNSWRVRELNYQDIRRCVDACFDAEATGDDAHVCVNELCEGRTVLEPARPGLDPIIRYVVDFDTAFPPTATHPGYTSRTLHGLFQIVFAPEAMDFDDWLSLASAAYFINHYPNDLPLNYEALVDEMATFEAGVDGAYLRFDVTGLEDLKLYYAYTASGVDTVRLQYSADGGDTWKNIHHAFSLINTGAFPTGVRMEVLPVEAYDTDDLRVRWIPHGLWGETNWSDADFDLTDITLVSGLQISDVRRTTSPILGIGQFPVRSETVNLRGTFSVMSPEIMILDGADASGLDLLSWTSADPIRARVVNTPTGANVRGMRGGNNIVITVASVADPSIFTDFRINVDGAAVTQDPNAQFVITSPYSEVDWDTVGRYKAAHHIHTTTSDGRSSVARTAERLYELGFHIASITDHSVTNVFPNRTLSGISSHYSDTNDPDAYARVPLTSDRLAQMREGVGRNGAGLMFIPGSNEHSSVIFNDISQRPTGHHINTYFSFLPSGNTGGNNANTMVGLINAVNAERRGGIFRINHIGRYTGSQWEAPWELASSIANSASNFMPYANLFLQSHTVNGIEIINKFDTETQADRILWDNILSNTMPYGIPSWGYSDDDSHSDYALGFSYNLMLMPELNMGELRNAMDVGAFFAFSRVDRQYNVYAEGLRSWDWPGPTDFDTEGIHATGDTINRYHRSRHALNLPKPVVNSIDVDEDANTITIDATIHRRGDAQPTVIDDCDEFFINWYADGNVIHTGRTLDLVQHQRFVYSYVRASIVAAGPLRHGGNPDNFILDEHDGPRHRGYGVLYTQPFEIQRVGEAMSENVRARVAHGHDTTVRPRPIPNLTAIDANVRLSVVHDGGIPEAMVNSNGEIFAAGIEALVLPQAIAITTDMCGSARGGQRFASISWDLSTLDNFDVIDSTTYEMTVTGQIMLPTGIKAVTNNGGNNFDPFDLELEAIIRFVSPCNVNGDEPCNFVELDNPTPPTCTTSGATHKCEGCGMTTGEPATGCNFGEWETYREPTTTETGLARRTCEHCGEFDWDIIPRLPITAPELDPFAVELMLRSVNDWDSDRTLRSERLRITEEGEFEISFDLPVEDEHRRLTNIAIRSAGASFLQNHEAGTSIAPDSALNGVLVNIDNVTINDIEVSGIRMSAGEIEGGGIGLVSQLTNGAANITVPRMTVSLWNAFWAADQRIQVTEGLNLTDEVGTNQPGISLANDSVITNVTITFTINGINDTGTADDCALGQCVWSVWSVVNNRGRSTCTIAGCTRVRLCTVYISCGFASCNTCDGAAELCDCNLICCDDCEDGTYNCGEDDCDVCPDFCDPDNVDACTPGDVATCETSQICTVCYRVLVSAIGHEFGNWTPWTPARSQNNCGQAIEQIRTGTCTRAGCNAITAAGAEGTTRMLPAGDCHIAGCSRCRSSDPTCVHNFPTTVNTRNTRANCGATTRVVTCTRSNCNVTHTISVPRNLRACLDAACTRETCVTCDCKNCEDCGFLGGQYGFGRVTGGEEISIADALAVLRHLVGLPNPIDDNENSRAAAAITSPGGEITIADALAILRYLVGLPSPISDE